jgi:hypothetical protein
MQSPLRVFRRMGTLARRPRNSSRARVPNLRNQHAAATATRLGKPSRRPPPELRFLADFAKLARSTATQIL